MDAKGNCIQGSCWEMKLEHLDADKKNGGDHFFRCENNSILCPLSNKTRCKLRHLGNNL